MGLCWGVRRALRIVDDALAAVPGAPVYSLGPLIHNSRVVEEYHRRGVTCVREVPAVESGTMIIPAHGAGPAERQSCRERGLEIVDATCPRVARIQELAAAHDAQGYGVIVVGDAGHREVKGIRAHAAVSLAISRIEEAEAADLSGRPWLVVSQTTFRHADLALICRALESRSADLLIRDTGCSATEERQKSLLRLAPEVDALLVIGSKESANTRRLYETARETGRPSWHIEGADELPAGLGAYGVVGISAGASTPDSIVDEVEAAILV